MTTGSLPSALIDVGSAVVTSALGAFVRTVLAMLVLGGGLAIGGYLYAAPRSTLAGVAAALLALTLCVVLGVVLGAKRAMAVGVAAGVHRSQLASRVVGPLFDRLANVPGVAATERMPLAQVEAHLRTVVTSWLGDAPRGLRGVVARGLVGRIERLTLAELRSDDRDATGVDLAVVRARMIDRADAMVVDQIHATTRVATLALVGAAALGSIAIAVALRHAG